MFRLGEHGDDSFSDDKLAMSWLLVSYLLSFRAPQMSDYLHRLAIGEPHERAWPA